MYTVCINFTYFRYYRYDAKIIRIHMYTIFSCIGVPIQLGMRITDVFLQYLVLLEARP